MINNSLSIGSASKLLGVSISTLRRWNKLGKLSSFRTFGNHRRFFTNDVLNIIHPKKRLHVGYARVSSHEQKNDLETQSKRVLKAIEHNDNHLLISDLGSGLNYKKKGLNKLINMIINFQVDTLYLTHKDRLIRFGSELIYLYVITMVLKLLF